MAYDALLSLKHTIQQLMHSSDILLFHPSTQIIESAYKEVNSLHKHFKKLDSRSRKRCLNASLDEGLREELCKFEDVIESHVSNQLLISQSVHGGTSFSIDLQDLKPEICSFTVALKKMRWTYMRESSYTDATDDDDAAADDDDGSSSLIDSGENKPMIVGYSDKISHVKEKLMLRDVDTIFFTLVGMAGIGKTLLAKEIFEDPDIVERFETRVWLKFSRKKYTYMGIARRILDQLNPDSDKLVTRGPQEISRDLRKSLESKRCFIVLEDVWDAELIEVLQRKLHGSRVLLITRRHQVARKGDFDYFLKMELLNKEEGWNLFRAKVLFAEELCPHELVKPGKKISEKCEGLPLLIVTVANLLSKKEKSLEYWNEVAEDKQNQLLKDACEEIEEVLFPSYDHLPQHLKMCFLYMGVFPQDYEIPISTIVNLWTAEGFLELNEYYKTSESCTVNHLNELIWNNVLLVYQRSSRSSWKAEVDVKTCGLHCSFWHLCNREAEKNKFLHVLNNLEDGLEEGIKGHRRLCIHNNVLLGIKDVYNSIESVCASTARSLLCFGPYHQYEVPICFGLRLLKMLDALAIRFYDFPLDVLKLVLLRYLALTCNGKLPPSLTKLWKLQFLIVGRHLSIKSSRDPSYLPKEIWDMKELQHLQIMGSDLPDRPTGNRLPKLLKLIGVSAHSCTKEVFEGIPHLQKLKIIIELEPTETLRCFDHISNLSDLQSLKCVVVNPMFATPPSLAPSFMFPSSLKKLHLSGLGYPWEYMNKIAASLINLTELKLRCYAFRGPKWEIERKLFPELGFLLIEDTDLVQLKAVHGSFPWLRHISMKHCYKLRELHVAPQKPSSNITYRAPLERIELVDCNPVAVNYVRQTIEDGSTRNPLGGLVVHSSWIDGRNLKSSQEANWSKREFYKAQ